MAINLAWDGQEAEAGLNKTAHLLKATGIAALDAAQNFSKSIQDRVKNLGLSDSEIRSLTKLSELDKERALDRMEEEANLRRMSKNSQLLYEQMTQQAEESAKAEAILKNQQEARAKQLAGLSALDKQRLFTEENRKRMILGMSAKQQLAFEAQEKAAEKARAKAEAWADMTWIQKVKKSLQGAQDIKATIEMVRGLFRLLAAGPLAAGRGAGSVLTLSAELETAKINMGVLMGSFAKGADQLDRLRRVSVDLGVPLQDVSDAFRTLFVGGVNAGDSEQLLKTFGKIAPLLGQGGLGQLAQGIAGMAKSGMAEKSALDQLASTGLPVYEALAERLTNITGELHTVRMAQDSVERGAVLASTAIGAMQEAARSPQAMEAAKKFGESLDGQLLRLKEGAIDIFRDVGDLIRAEFPVDNILSALRGAVDAIASVIREMVKEFAKLNVNGDDLEANFKNARAFMLDMLEAVVKVMKTLVGLFEDLKNKLETAKATKSNFFAMPYKMGGWLTGKEAPLAGKLTNEAQNFGNDLLDIIKRMRENAGKAKDAAGNSMDLHHLLPMDRQVELPMRNLLDSFTEMRDLQTLALQGKQWDQGSVQSKVAGFIDKFGPKSDAGINQRIEAGSAAAAEAIMRSRTGVQEMSIGEAIKRAVEEAKDQQKEQTRIEGEMLDAIKRINMPAVAVIPR